ncbi:hypothetical protein AAMO2058_001075500 [Amorphochlora amoebiformis]
MGRKKESRRVFEYFLDDFEISEVAEVVAARGGDRMGIKERAEAALVEVHAMTRVMTRQMGDILSPSCSCGYRERGKPAKNASTIVRSVLAELDGAKRFMDESKDLIKSIKNFKNDLFESWKQENLDSLEDHKSPLRLETSGKLMELDIHGTGLLQVHFSERLVALLREVRQFSELGYKIPKKIVSAVDKGQKFYRYGLKLKQVANFYNTIGEQIIPSQMGMLALEAHNFERIVTRTDVRWDIPGSCEKYMEALMEAGEKLTSRNRRLRAKGLSL